eukprot:scaffold41220_cov71-Phaeocystis_antarctica.AAC.7
MYAKARGKVAAKMPLSAQTLRRQCTSVPWVRAFEPRARHKASTMMGDDVPTTVTRKSHFRPSSSDSAPKAGVARKARRPLAPSALPYTT